MMLLVEIPKLKMKGAVGQLEQTLSMVFAPKLKKIQKFHLKRQLG